MFVIVWAVEFEVITKLQRSSAGNRVPMLYVRRNPEVGPTRRSASLTAGGLPELIITLVALIVKAVEVLQAAMAGVQSYSKGATPSDMSIAKLPFKEIRPPVLVLTFESGGLMCSATV